MNENENENVLLRMGFTSHYQSTELVIDRKEWKRRVNRADL